MAKSTTDNRKGGLLDLIERVGNALPDPAVLVLGLMLRIGLLSALSAGVAFTVIDPRTGAPIV
ncbi:MAG: hypothetical protein ACK4L7_11680, partial [Flavobacteriales bacterium]